jgi:AcrR family transcriptional regulator
MQSTAETVSPPRRSLKARAALIAAAARLLPSRAPSAISGRELAAEAGVNYGLIHHYFGGKESVLSAGLVVLRDDFLLTYGDAAELRLLTTPHPYLQALVRSMADYPDSITTGGEFPVGSALVEAVASRLGTGPTAEAKARVISMVSMQLCYTTFSTALLDATSVTEAQRADVEAALSRIYDSLAAIDDA